MKFVANLVLAIATVFSFVLMPVHLVSAQGSATLGWSSSSLSVNVNGTSTVVLSVNTAGAETTGTDVLLNYNPATIEIVSVNFNSLYANQFSNNDTANGVLTLNATYSDIISFYKGTGNLATLTIRGKQAGSTQLSFQCTNGQTNDTNILQRLTATDLVNCGSLASLPITVSQQSQETPTPTANPTENPTTNPTSTPTTTNNDGTACSTLNSAPTGLSARAQSSTSILLTWTKEANASTYALQYGTAPNSYRYGASSMGNVDRFLVTYLSPNTTYYFAVAGKNNCSTSSYITASARTLGSGTGTTTQATARPVTSTNTFPTAAPTPFPTPVVPSFDTLVTQNDTQPTISDEVVDPFATPAPVEDFLPPKATSTLPVSLPVLVAGISLALILFVALIVLLMKRMSHEEQVPPTSTPGGGMQEV